MSNTAYFHSDGIDAYILVGGVSPGFDFSVPNKNFIKIKKRALFIHVLSALLQVERFKKIFVVGPKKAIERELEDSGLEVAAGKVTAIEESTDIVQNIWIPFVNSLGGIDPGEAEKNKELANKAIFATSGDCPLMTPMEVNQFLNECEKYGEKDYFMGMTPKKNLDFFAGGGNEPGIRLSYSHFAEDLLRVNNLHLIKPFKIRNKNEFAEFYKVRRLKKILNIVRSGAGLIQRRLDLDGLSGWAEMILSMKLRKYDFNRLSDVIRSLVPLSRAERVVGSLLGAECKVAITTIGGCALDVDHPSNVGVIESMYDRWMEIQLREAEKEGF